MKENVSGCFFSEHSIDRQFQLATTRLLTLNLLTSNLNLLRTTSSVQFTSQLNDFKARTISHFVHFRVYKCTSFQQCLPFLDESQEYWEGNEDDLLLSATKPSISNWKFDSCQNKGQDLKQLWHRQHHNMLPVLHVTTCFARNEGA